MTKILKFLLLPMMFYIDAPDGAAPIEAPAPGDTPPADGAPALDADGKPIENAGTKELTAKTPEEEAAAKAAADAEAEGMKVPESPDDYKLPVPEGDDGAFAKVAAGWFHKNGVPPVMAEKMAADWNAYAAEQKALGEKAATEAAANADKQLEAQFTEETGALKKEWGDKYDGNIELGKRAVQQFDVSEDILNAIEDKVGPAGLFKFFAKIGAGLGEDSLLGVTSGQSITGGTGAQTLYPAHYTK